MKVAYLRSYRAPRRWTALEREQDLVSGSTAAHFLSLSAREFRALGLRPVAMLGTSPRWSILEIQAILAGAWRRPEWLNALRAVLA